MGKSKSSKDPIKSIVSSVESMLPKGISLMHVVLAVVLGLMICSFLNDSMVEGLSGRPKANVLSGNLDSIDKGKYGCAPNYTATVMGGTPPLPSGAAANTANKACYKAGSSGAQGTWLDPVKGTKTDSNKKYVWGNTAITSGGGECSLNEKSWLTLVAEGSVKGDEATAKVSQKAQCMGHIADKCIKDLMCSWTNCKDLEKLDSIDDINLLANCKKGVSSKATFDIDNAVSTFKWLNPTEMPALIADKGKRGEAEDKSQWGKRAIADNALPDANKKGTGNLLDFAGCQWQDSTKTWNCNRTNVPEKLQDHLENEAKNCKRGWDKLDPKKNLGYYTKNFGRPILGWKTGKGIICGNPFYDKFEVELDESKLIFNKDLCKGANVSCPCKRGASAKSYSTPAAWGDRFEQIGKGLIGQNPQCLDAAIAKENTVWCGAHSAMYNLRDGLGEFITTANRMIDPEVVQTCRT